MSDLPEGFEERIQAVCGMSSEEFQQIDEQQWCFLHDFYGTGLEQGRKMQREIDVNPDDLNELLDEKYEDIEFMLSVIHEIYAISGEDVAIAKLCNKVLTESRVPIPE